MPLPLTIATSDAEERKKTSLRQVFPQYILKLFLYYFVNIASDTVYSSHVPSIVAFLGSTAPPWVLDTGLHLVDGKVAKMLNDTWNSDRLNGDFNESADYNFQYLLYQAFSNYTSGHFLNLATNGGLLHSPL